jgi:hypothetical protein
MHSISETKNLNVVTMSIQKDATAVVAYLPTAPFSETLITALVCDTLGVHMIKRFRIKHLMINSCMQKNKIGRKWKTKEDSL